MKSLKTHGTTNTAPKSNRAVPSDLGASKSTPEPGNRPYLTDVFRRNPAIAPGDTAALEALLPDRWVAAHPEHRLEQREEESHEAQARRRLKRAVHRAAIAS